MKQGDIIRTKTHAELLNKLLGTQYKQWYKCTYDLDDNTFIWIVSLDNSSNAGHRNKFLNNTTIIEQFDKNDTFSKERFLHGINREFRLVFEKIETANGRLYKFHGLYKLIRVENDGYKRTLKLSSLIYTF